MKQYSIIAENLMKVSHFVAILYGKISSWKAEKETQSDVIYFSFFTEMEIEDVSSLIRKGGFRTETLERLF